MVATWCQRDNSTQPFTPAEEQKLDFLYSEWTHPHFISINVRVGCGCGGAVWFAEALGYSYMSNRCVV